MKSSVVLAISGAVLATAAVIDPRAIETQLHIEWVTITVTAGQEPPEATQTNTPGQFFERPVSEEKPNAPVFSTILPPPPAEEEEEDESNSAPPPPPPPAPTTTSTTTTSTQAPKETDDGDSGSAPSGSMQEAALNAHNIHRRDHGAPDLKWSSQVAGYARQTAETCVFKHDLTPGGGGYGQNLAMWGATDGADLGEAKAIHMAASDMWYKGEVGLYQWYGGEPDMSNFSAWGHFSQLVWVDTEEVGCYVKYCEKGTMNPNMGIWYSVCNYVSAGNMRNSYAANVLPAN